MTEELAKKVILETAAITENDWDAEGVIDSLGMIEVLTALETAGDMKIDINVNPNDREIVVMKTPRAILDKLKERGYIS